MCNNGHCQSLRLDKIIYTVRENSMRISIYQELREINYFIMRVWGGAESKPKRYRIFNLVENMFKK